VAAGHNPGLSEHGRLRIRRQSINAMEEIVPAVNRQRTDRLWYCFSRKANVQILDMNGLSWERNTGLNSSHSRKSNSEVMTIFVENCEPDSNPF
jgi:hypothetical protein